MATGDFKLYPHAPLGSPAPGRSVTPMVKGMFNCVNSSYGALCSRAVQVAGIRGRRMQSKRTSASQPGSISRAHDAGTAEDERVTRSAAPARDPSSEREREPRGAAPELVDDGAHITGAEAQMRELEGLGVFSPKRIQPYQLKSEDWESILLGAYVKETAEHHATRFPYYSGCLVYKHRDQRKRTVRARWRALRGWGWGWACPHAYGKIAAELLLRSASKRTGMPHHWILGLAWPRTPLGSACVWRVAVAHALARPSGHAVLPPRHPSCAYAAPAAAADLRLPLLPSAGPLLLRLHMPQRQGGGA